MHTRSPQRPRPEALSFDPVCGSPLPPLFEANPYRSGGYTYYFCSAMCRRFFIDQKHFEASGASSEDSTTAVSAQEGRPS